MANFAVRLGRSSGWDSSHPIREQDGWDAHAAFMDGLVDDGFIILGGPVGSGEETLHVVEAADEDEIRERLADDPWASAGLLRIGRIEPWLLWLDGRAGNPARLDHASFHPGRRLSRAGFNAPAGTGRGRTGKIATAAPVVGSGGGTQRERGTSSVAVGFDEMTRRILDGKNFPTVATINPDGGPQASVVWILRDGDTVMFSATANRRKVRNLARDRRISMTVFDLADPYQSVEIRGTAELENDPERWLPRAVSQKYLGSDPEPEPADVTRVIVRVRPERVNTFSA